jgi:hypothetical protein
MQADGRTLRQHGTLRLVALRAWATAERYVLVQDGRVIAGGFPSLAAAVARFERLQREALRQAALGLVGEAASMGAGATVGAAGAASPTAPEAADNVVSLEAYRRRRF